MTIMKTLALTLAWWICFYCIAVLANSESTLPTSDVNIDTATNTAKSVMVCRLTDLGWVDFRGPAATAYDEAKFDVITTLKGESASKIVCSLMILGHPLNPNEKAPVVGENYVVIGDNKEGKFALQKFLAATPDNIAKVQHILSHSELTSNALDASATKPLTELSHPGISLPKAPKQAAEAKPSPTAPHEEPASSTPWSIIVVLIVVALGLLWLLFKRRS